MSALYRVTIFIILCTVAIQSHAQNFYTAPNTTVSVLKGATVADNIQLFVTDTLINEGTLTNTGDIDALSLVNKGILSNDGNLSIRGLWLNQGTYDPGEGQITFNSTDPSVPQIINHNNQSISKLVISGGGLKQILADLTVEESLTLTDGIITAQGNSGVHFSSTATITGGSDNAHIQAKVYQQGTGNKVFPIGNGTSYLPVEVNGISANSEIGIALIELTNGQTLSTNSSLADISDKRYWTVEVISGSLNGATIVLPVEGDEGLDISKNSEFVIALAPSVSEDFVSIGRNLNSSNARIESDQSPTTGVVTLAVPSENLSIVVFNAISPNPDDEINNYIHIDNLVETDVVSIYNRWGDLVFEIKNYDNAEVGKRFNGQSNVGGAKDLPTGNYFYTIRRKSGKEVSGYLSLRR